MYIITSVNHDTTDNSSSWTSNTGAFSRPFFQAGSADNCSENSAALRAIAQGLKHVMSTFGPGYAPVNVMVPTAKLAKELNAVTTISLSTKMGDDAAIWAEIASHKATSSIKFGTCLKELPELATPFLGWTAGMV
jgi:hypothetical protein